MTDGARTYVFRRRTVIVDTIAIRAGSLREARPTLEAIPAPGSPVDHAIRNSRLAGLSMKLLCTEEKGARHDF